VTLKVVVAGIGSSYRHDDGVGPAVADLVAQTGLDISDIGPLGEPLDLLGRWDDADLVVVIDAVRSDRAPGTIALLELDGLDADDAAASVTSTHGIGLVGALRIARAIGQAPQRVVVVAIEGAAFDAGVGLTPSVADAVGLATTQIVELVEAAR
jgi:hydrogenase maturation protease